MLFNLNTSLILFLLTTVYVLNEDTLLSINSLAPPLQDESMSLLSVHMGLENLYQQRNPSLNLDSMDKQDSLVATGGRCFALVRGPELRSGNLKIRGLLLKVRE